MEIKSADIVKCLPVLASVLGAKYGVKVVIGGNKACTDGNVIYLPALPVDSDEELLMLVKGYTDHESAHIRYTDFEQLGNASLTKIEKEIFNCIEDWRVEQKLSELYPGCRHNLDRLIQRFFVEQDDWAGETPALSILSYVLLTLRSWDVKDVCEPLRIRGYVLEQNYPALKSALDSILSRIRLRCEDTAAAMVYAREIVSCIAQNENNNPSGEQLTAQEQRLASDAEGMQSDNMQNNGHNGGKCSDETPSMPIPSGIENSEESHNDSYEADMAERSHGTDENGLIAEINVACGEIKGIGEKIADALENRKGDRNETAIDVAVECEPWQERLDNEECADALRATMALRQRLQGLLQTRDLKRIATGRHGKLCQRNLYRLSTANPNVFSKQTVKNEVQTAIHILLDRSSSMGGDRIALARQTCYAISKALDVVKGIAHAVSAFPMHQQDGIVGIIPVKRYEQSTRENFALSACGSTPLDAAIWGVLPALLSRREQRKLLLVITDGRPDRLNAAQAAITRAKEFGVEVYAIGIQSTVEELNASSGTMIQNLDELPRAVFEMLGKIL